jgi:hypothetical protein
MNSTRCVGESQPIGYRGAKVSGPTWDESSVGALEVLLPAASAFRPAAIALRCTIDEQVARQKRERVDLTLTLRVLSSRSRSAWRDLGAEQFDSPASFTTLQKKARISLVRLHNVPELQLTLSADMPFSRGGRLGAAPALATAKAAGARGGGVGANEAVKLLLLVELRGSPAGLNKLGGDAES